MRRRQSRKQNNWGRVPAVGNGQGQEGGGSRIIIQKYVIIHKFGKHLDLHGSSSI